MRSSVEVGLMGLGTVGNGVARILTQQAELIERRLGCPLRLRWIAEPNIEKHRGFKRHKIRFTQDAREMIDDPAIDIVVELIGGIHPAREYLLDAMKRGRHVVTANKALLALHGEEIFQVAQQQAVEIGFEGSVCGGIPILRALKEGFAADAISEIRGIVNGTSNFILTRMTEEGLAFAEALTDAQNLGYAEANPTLDVNGEDAAHKLAILANLAFGSPVALQEIYTEGIERVLPIDIAFADTLGYRIKLLAIAKQMNDEIEVRVHPTLIPKDNPLATVRGVYNAVYLVGHSIGESLLYGLGAGGAPTGSAVVADLIDIARNILKGTSGRVPPTSFERRADPALRIRSIEEIHTRYYLRFMAQDEPGVLSKISGVLGRFRIGIASVIQHGRKVGGHVPLIVMTYRACEQDMRKALSRIDRMPEVSGPIGLIRIEGHDD